MYDDVTGRYLLAHDTTGICCFKETLFSHEMIRLITVFLTERRIPTADDASDLSSALGDRSEEVHTCRLSCTGQYLHCYVN